MISILLVACGGSPAAPHPTAPAPTPTAQPTSPPPRYRGGNPPRGAAPANNGASDPALASISVPAIGCLAPTCAFHAGAGAYFTCLAGGAGTCFHFGAACAPADACMYDPGDRQYKTCAKPSEGVCTQWGAACAPVSKCMFDPADGLHHQCDDVAGGACKRFGALCAP